jgi:DNA replication protein DnaC
MLPQAAGFPQRAELARGGVRAYARAMAFADCPKCGGTGYKIVEGDVELSPAVAGVPEEAARQAGANGVHAFAVAKEQGAAAGSPRIAVLCDCVEGERAARAIVRARIPARYEHCDFESFETDIYAETPQAAGFNSSLAQAKLIVEGFSRDYPLSNDAGLMLMGPCGVGKTHLAIATLKELISRGHEGLFYDYRELLKEIQASYNPENQASEGSVLDPVLRAEVLILDDLGASKPSAWALETVGHILTTRYNEKRVTVITTNYLDAQAALPAAPEQDLRRGAGRFRSGETAAPTRDDSLAERIGVRIRSRLYEMCRTVEIMAPDFRREVRKATGSQH